MPNIELLDDSLLPEPRTMKHKERFVFSVTFLGLRLLGIVEQEPPS